MCVSVRVSVSVSCIFFYCNFFFFLLYGRQACLYQQPAGSMFSDWIIDILQQHAAGVLESVKKK